MIRSRKGVELCVEIVRVMVNAVITVSVKKMKRIRKNQGIKKHVVVHNNNFHFKFSILAD
jgi:hypothetical protein